MRRIDRYIIGVFARVFLICMFSMMGIYFTGHFVENLSRFIDYAEANPESGGVLKTLGAFYGVQVPWFFDQMGRVIALTAAVFTVTWLQRHNEMTALMAAGISRWRIVTPLVIAVALVAAVAAVNREAVIPRLRDQLSQNEDQLKGKKGLVVRPRHDHQNDILIDGQFTFADEQKIERPVFRLPNHMASFARQLSAANAYYRAPTADTPGGYLLDEVESPKDISEKPSYVAEGRTIVATPADHQWLKPNQCFVVSNVGFSQLAGGKTWRQYSSTSELIAGLHNPSLEFGADVRVTIHSRFVQPILDMALLFLGLPVVLRKESRNVFVSAGSCLLIVAIFFVVVVACHGMGSNYLLNPTFAAWCPLMIFVPVAIAMSAPLRR